ncbi:MAG: UDP-N-acetylenolpyruvoylglucosamine reductase [Planctomycetota bacterium]|nr:MAG: UDP-N-acetylenolpyruvoylglucosamine reductase [Planctomycetota bacterium]
MNHPEFEFAYIDYPLAPHTYYKIGGPANVALLPRTDDEARQAYAWMMEQPLPRLVIGGGSNLLIHDSGFPGIVLFTTLLRRFDELGGGRYRVAAGLVLSEMVREVMLPNNYGGVGGLVGIPGTVGGAIFMNAGTSNGSTCKLLESVDVLKPSMLDRVAITEDHYGYRSQTFCTPDDVILNGVFHFTQASEDQQAIYDHYQKRRMEKLPQGRCCGSVFKNPPEEHAGRLIEACGLKGTRKGGAVISPRHANFIMNENNASCEDVLYLIRLVEQTVRADRGIELEREVRIIA